MSWLLSLFGPLGREASILYYERALRQIDPANPDVPGIVLELCRLKDARPA